jgi:probable rRNA maturation factor
MVKTRIRNSTAVPVDPRAASRWIRAAARILGKDRGEVGLLFCGDALCRRYNRAWFGRRCPTDVMAFPDGEDGYWGDILVNVRQARRQAAALGIPLRQELKRLTVHGFLHLHGYDHTADRGEMEALQEKLVRRA